MRRHDLWRGLTRVVAGIVTIVLLSSTTLAQNNQPAEPKAEAAESTKGDPQPTTQPAEGQTDDNLRRLLELREKSGPAVVPAVRPSAEKLPVKPKAKPMPKTGAAASQASEEAASKPAPSPKKPRSDRSLEDLKRRARTSTQQATRPTRTAGRPGDDLLGPMYLPATPKSKWPAAARHARDSEPDRRRDRDDEDDRFAEDDRDKTPVSTASDDLEWFNFDGAMWEDVVQYFAERVGKPILNFDELVIGGELTYRSERKFTQEEAIDELNLIMHMVGFRFVETENHIFVVPLSEMNMYLDVHQVYPTRTAFEVAEPRPTDYVAVFVQVKDHPAKKIQAMFETMLPDYMTIMALDDSNQLKLVGLVQDIHKFLGLMDRVSVEEDDPLETRIFSTQVVGSA